MQKAKPDQVIRLFCCVSDDHWEAGSFLTCPQDAGATSVARSLRTIQVLAGREVFVFREMGRTERFGDFHFFIEPFSEINQLAALGAERPILERKPITGFSTGWACNSWHRFHGAN
jgi:hypothetical protein